MSAEHCSGQRQSGVKWSAVSKAERCSGQSLVKQSDVWDRDRAEQSAVWDRVEPSGVLFGTALLFYI